MISKAPTTLNNGQLNDWQLLAQLNQIFRSVSDTFTDQVDMHRGQAVLLCVVCGKNGLTQTEIAEQLSIQGATVTNMLQRMEEAGLVIRRRDPEDNRLVRVYVTEAGRSKEAEISTQFLNMQEMLFKGLSVEERIVLRRLLQQLIQNMTTQS